MLVFVMVLQETDVAVPVVTAPGDVAQVDFGYAGRLADPTTGKLRRAWLSSVGAHVETRVMQCTT